MIFGGCASPLFGISDFFLTFALVRENPKAAVV